MYISVIIPFYNVAIETFRLTLRSIYNQPYKSLEVIVVNDGSKLQYETELEKLRDEFGFELINQDNQGVSAARNRGIAQANGKYITFVDADDIVSNCFFEEAQKYIEQYDTDIIFGNIVFSCYEKGILNRLTFENCSVFDYENVRMAALQYKKAPIYYDLTKKDIRDYVKKKLMGDEKSNYVLLGSPCGSLYKTEYAKMVMFDENIKICEDQIFNYELLCKCNNCLVVSNEWYFYIQRNSSAMHTNNDNHEKYFEYWNKLIEIYLHENNTIKEDFSIYALRVMGNAIRIIVDSDSNIFRSVKKIKLVINHNIKNIAISANNYNLSKNNILKKTLIKINASIPLYFLYKIKNIAFLEQRSNKELFKDND